MPRYRSYKLEYIPLAEYLSNTGDTEVLARIGEMQGKCILKTNGRYYNAYFTPGGLIENFNPEDSTLSIRMIDAIQIGTRTEVDDPPYCQSQRRYTTFRYELTNKISKRVVKVEKHTGRIKVGTECIGTYSLRQYDLDKTEELLTWQIYPD